MNILTNLAFHKREITVFGGEQRRPNLHIQDMTDLYIQTLRWPAEKIDRKIYNAGWQNLSIRAIADLARAEAGERRADRHVPDGRPAVVPRFERED